MSLTRKDNVRTVIELQRRAVDHDAWRACINCDYWKGSENICTKWKATPPMQTIVLSCEEWMYKIPF